jgi:hypothetical protein
MGGGYKRLANVATYSEKILKKLIYKKLRQTAGHAGHA